MLTILLGSAVHLHEPGLDHPDAPTRIERLAESLAEAGYTICSCQREATRGELLMVHAFDYVDRVLAQNGVTTALDHETWLGPRSVSAALNAAGTALQLSDDLMCAEGQQIFALIRPPGHHALPSAAMGYCIFNNVALAAENLRRKGFRVCVLDLDVHHGNGTEQVFYACPDVLFVSIHADSLFPLDTGKAANVGDGPGRGLTVNVPLPNGASLAAYALAINSVVVPIAKRFCADVVLVSLGFDAHERDPHGTMRLTADDFTYIGAAIRMVALESARGRIGLVLEGGYDVDVIGACAVATMRGLKKNLGDLSLSELPSEEEMARIAEVARIHGLPALPKQL